MCKILVSKELFNNILLRKERIVIKESSKYWRNKLFDIKIVDNKIIYTTKQIKNLSITCGLKKDSPSLIVQCLDIKHNVSKGKFEFYLGEIKEQKNTNLKNDYKDILIEELLKEKKLLEKRITKDSLTQVYNRAKMQEDLNNFVRQNNKDLLSAIFIDADRFKNINDTFGHSMGDKVLVYIAKTLKKHSKLLNGYVYRYGGEEFVILCFMDKHSLITKVLDLKEDVKSYNFYSQEKEFFVSVSIGISFFSECVDSEELLFKADKSLYKAKKSGRDCIEIL